MKYIFDNFGNQKLFSYTKIKSNKIIIVSINLLKINIDNY